MPKNNFQFKISNFHSKSGQGFTLIELLVAIAILAIISTIGLATYTNAQKYARDTRRKEDLRSIQIALDFYYQANNHYPIYTQFGPISPTHDKTRAIQGGWLTSCQNMGSSFSCLPNQGFWIHDDTLNEHFDSRYINSMPVDPINNRCCNNSTDYIYAYKTNDYAGSGSDPGCPGEGKWYVLTAKLENDQDPDAINKKPVMWCDGVTLLNGNPSQVHDWFIHPNLFMIVHKR